MVFKTKVFDTTEDESQFAPVPVGSGLPAGDSDAARRAENSRKIQADKAA